MMDPRLSVNTFMARTVPFAELLKICEEVGAQGVGIQVDEAVTPAKLRVLERSSLVPTSVSGFLNCLQIADAGIQWRRGSDEALAIARDLGVPLIVTLGSVSRSWPLSLWRARMGECLQLMADTAERLGVQVAIEPLSAPDAKWSAVVGLADSSQILAHTPLLTMVPDIWHLWADPGLPGILRDSAPKLPLVHISDFDPDRLDERVAPGEGIADVAYMVNCLLSGGFSGWLELEVLPSSLSIEEPRRHLVRTFGALVTMMRSVTS